jgi:hypothetical protein
MEQCLQTLAVAMELAEAGHEACDPSSSHVSDMRGWSARVISGGRSPVVAILGPNLLVGDYLGAEKIWVPYALQFGLLSVRLHLIILLYCRYYSSCCWLASLAMLRFCEQS